MSPSPELMRYTPKMDRAMAPTLIHDLSSPKKIIIVMVTITGYIKLIVDATPLAIFAYPIRRVIEVIARRALSKAIFQASSKDEI
jgi:hypothetical protein